jgi:[acyl-carrier-protein] S-malonyltransferase
MKTAQAEFGTAADGVSFRPPSVPWISNVSGRVEQDPQVIRERLVQCVTATVRWRDVMSTCQGLGVTALLEGGPGRVLCGLARANGFGTETTCLPVNNLRGVMTAARHVATGGIR